MGVARHGNGLRAEFRALGSQVHPVFMLPPIAASLFGAILAETVDATPAMFHVAAVFLAVYTAHLKDGYIDFHNRREDDDHPITERGCRLLLAVSSLAFFGALLGLWTRVGPTAAVLTLPTWAIAIAHAPQLDLHPIGATAGYPTGIAVALVSGYYVQTGSIDPIALAFGLVFLILLSGVKIIDDEQDYEYDRSIEKRTVAVSIGPRRARRVADGLMLGAMVAVIGFAATETFPPSTALAPAIFGIVMFTTRRAGPELATMLLIRGSYLFLAVLVGAVWFQPLAG